MPYIGAGTQRFNTADGLTVSGNASVSGTTALTGNATAAGNLDVTGNVDVDGTTTVDGLTSSAALDVTTSTHANASVFKSTGNTQIMLQDTDASSNDQFWGFQVSGGDFNILTCDDDRSGGFVTPLTIAQAGNTTLTCTAGDSNQALQAYHPTSTSARNIAKFQSNVGSTQADVVTIGCDGGIEAIGEITTTNSLSQNSNSIRTAIGNDGGSATFGTSTNHQIRLFTNNTEQGLLDTSGRFLINRTSVPSVNPHSKLHVLADSAVSAATIQIGTNGYAGISFLNAAGSDVGSIVINASSTAYNTSSDYRLKQDVQDMTGAIDRVKTLAPKRFQFTAEPNTTVDGFLAHEAQAVVPEAVTGTHNETRTITNAILSSGGKLITEDVTEEDWTAGKKATEDANGNTVDALYPSDSTWSAKHTEPVMQGIDQSKLVPLLTAALKESIAKIETLETEMTALKARVTTLEGE